ncbi:MAG: prepilin-type N-terminal cleavage/methylation domain-containing protein [Desulfobacteraceae bacterium]|nr:MAG: prepilin-type N-terminal cleavage/methylation domain-containing protein [Desulfobacteraceae bacterium]
MAAKSREHSTTQPLNHLTDSGFSLIEIVAALFILAVAIVPMIKAYAPALSSTTGKEEMVVFANQARGTLYRLLALDYATLNANLGDPADLSSLFGSGAEAAKETFMLNGRSYTPKLSIADAGGGPEGLLELTVTLENVVLSTLKANL